MNIDSMIHAIKDRVLYESLDEFSVRKQAFELKPLVYTSFDGDYMPFMFHMMKYALTNGFLPVNPEAALGYYVSTVTHDNQKIAVMRDCLSEELLCDEMWIFDPLDGRISEGVLAELLAWNESKKTLIRKIPAFNQLQFTRDVYQGDPDLERYVLPPSGISSYLNAFERKDVLEIQDKLFNGNDKLPSQTYIVINFNNYKHIDWARAYCYERGLCPVSPQSILPHFLYHSICSPECESTYMIDRLTLLDRCHQLLWFINAKDLVGELQRLDAYSCTELYYFYQTFGVQSIKIVDWADSGVPKYLRNAQWALTQREAQGENVSTQDLDSYSYIQVLQQKIFAYENLIKDTFNIFKGGLLGKAECEFILGNMNAFLFGLIADSSVKAEIAWSLPYRLSERLRHFDLYRISKMDPDELKRTIQEKPALHRYPSNIAKYLQSAAQLLIQKYNSDASNIWANNASASEIVSRLEEFKGISHKKAALGSLLLVRDLGISIKDKENINLAYDIHIRRICLRAGFCKQDTLEEVTLAGKRIFPEFPGRLTSSFWAIGRDICRPSNPLCNKCPLDEVCAHHLLLGGDIRA